nr:hypothetical protein [Methylomarinum sp. Ch1-1]MDP4520734.1 hypothetical protein [Methylomarinum sp. Ch1-1]
MMDIKLPLPSLSLPAGKGRLDTSLLQLNQYLDVKVVDADVAKNNLALQLGNKILQTQSDKPVDIKAGQKLTLQVVKLSPLIEFKVVAAQTETPGQQNQHPLRLSVFFRTPVETGFTASQQPKRNIGIIATIAARPAFADASDRGRRRAADRHGIRRRRRP